MRQIIIVLVAGLLLGWLVNGWKLGEQLVEQSREHEQQLRATAEANAAVILEQQAYRLYLESRQSLLDTQSTQELLNAKAENERLRRLYGSADDERRRLRIEVRVARADATVSAATGAGRLGNAASVELSERAGSAVWYIRAGMIEDQAKLRFLQNAFRLQQRLLPE